MVRSGFSVPSQFAGDAPGPGGEGVLDGVESCCGVEVERECRAGFAAGTTAGAVSCLPVGDVEGCGQHVGDLCQ
jgi:hypothetical protein